MKGQPARGVGRCDDPPRCCTAFCEGLLSFCGVFPFFFPRLSPPCHLPRVRRLPQKGARRPSMRTRHVSRITLAIASGILLASRALAVFPTTPPNDPDYAPDTCPPATTCHGPTGQWNLLSFNDNVPFTTGASGISADLAWQVTTGRPDVVIAILDSGVNYDHEDLRNKIWLNRGELPIPVGACCTPPAGDAWDCNT